MRHPLRGGRCDGERDDLIGREVREGGQVVVDADEREVGFVLDDLDGVLVTRPFCRVQDNPENLLPDLVKDF